jgi:hypothetical protein
VKGHYRIVPASQMKPADTNLPNDLRACRVEVNASGIYSFVETNAPAPWRTYDRGDPEENERALREAMPELYLSFKP